MPSAGTFETFSHDDLGGAFSDFSAFNKDQGLGARGRRK